MYPQAKNGGNKNVVKGRQTRKRIPFSGETESGRDDVVVFDFARALAEKVGLGPTQIRAAVRIWVNLTPESKRRLAGTDLARKHTELLALAEQSAPKQTRILDLILGDDRPENVTQALEWIASGGSLPDMHERRFFAFSRSFGALAEAAFDSLLSAHEQRIIASLTRRGRI